MADLLLIIDHRQLVEQLGHIGDEAKRGLGSRIMTCSAAKVFRPNGQSRDQDTIWAQLRAVPLC
jgi:hypothetical protein